MRIFPWSSRMTRFTTYSGTVILAAGLSATLVLFLFIRHTEREALSARFDHDAESTASLLTNELVTCGRTIQSLALFLHASGVVDPVAFKAFTQPILMDQKELRALEWIPRVTSPERRGFEHKATMMHAKDFQITERNEAGGSIPARPRPDYFPVYYVEPLEGNEAALGFDLVSNPARKAALDAARDLGTPVATGRVHLVQEPGRQFGFLVFVPVYRLGWPTEMIQQRREALRGFALGVFRVGDVLAQVEHVAGRLHKEMQLTLTDRSAPPAEQSMHPEPFPVTGPARGLHWLSPGIPPFMRTFEFAGRRWGIEVTAGPDYLATHARTTSWWTLPIGLLLTFGAYAMQSLTVRHRRSAQLVEVQASEVDTLNKDLAKEISDRKDTESLLSTLISNLPVPFFFKDAEGRYRLCNPAFEAYTGLKSDRIIGRTALEVAPPDLGPVFHERDLAIIADGGPKIYEARERYPDGSTRDYLIRKARVQGDTGEVLGMTAIMFDITERKRAEQDLEEALALVRAVVEASPTGILCFHGGTGQCVLMNEMASTLFGIPRDEFRNMRFLTYAPWLNSGLTERLSEALQSDEEKLFEIPCAVPDGHQYWLRISLVGFDKGSERHLLLTAQDLSKRKQAEEALWQAQKLESLGLMAGGIAHEINTPTQFIGDNLAFLRETLLPLLDAVGALDEIEDSPGLPERFRILQGRLKAIDLGFLRTEVPLAIEQSSEGVARVTKIVRAMKDFSHPDSSVYEPLDVNRAIESTLIVARSEWKYVATVELELATSLPLVPCYHDAFNQAILNLIINAAHAIRESLGVADESRKGLIHIATRPVGRAVEIAISDNGSGIPESIRSKIFDPFFTTKPIGMGTGQGLTFVHNAIVEKHRGTISVNSEVGKGTTFILRIPLSQETSGGPPVRPGLSSSMPSQN